jgi:DNA-directed RNA polymerase specialized sigma subunit
VSGSGNQDKLGDSVAKIVDLQDEINQKIDKYVDLKREISALLEQIPDPDQVKVLHKRYFEYKPWEQIACEMNYSYRNVCYIHGKALQAFEALMEGAV